MRIGLIGAGGIANAHMNAYEQMPDAQICAVVDVVEDKAKQGAARFGAKAYTDLDQMFKEVELDMVDICVPSFLHHDIALKCFEQKLHVLCEKPIAHHLQDAREMIESAKRSGVHFMIAQVIRFWPEYMYLKKAYETEQYGALKHVFFSRMSPVPKWVEWYVDPEKSGMAPFELHIHDSDFIHYMFGGNPRSVHSSGIEDNSNNLSYIQTKYNYDNAIAIYAEAGWSNTVKPFSAAFRAVFEHGVLEFENEGLTLHPSEGESEYIEMDDEVSVDASINIKSSGGTFNEIKYFIECVRNNKAPQVVTPEDSYESLHLLLTEIESAKTGETLNL